MQTIGLKKGKTSGPASTGRPGAAQTQGKKGRKEKHSGPSGPLHDRRRRLVSAHDSMLKDLGGLLLEMYKRNRFREELLLDKCEEALAIEVEIAHVDQRLFQLGPTTVAGQRPIGRCECGAPVLPGQNFCGVCGRSFTTLTQSRTCERCSAGLRIGDAFCWSCGTPAPDRFAVIGAPKVSGTETTIDSSMSTPTISPAQPTPPPTSPPPAADTVTIPLPSPADQARASLPPDLAAPHSAPPAGPPPRSAADAEAEKKRLEKIKKARTKELKARAKVRAKEARKSRKGDK